MTPSTRVTRIIRMPLGTERQIHLALDALAKVRPSNSNDRARLSKFRQRATDAWWSRKAIPPAKVNPEIERAMQ
jgi:hypothetical protein